MANTLWKIHLSNIIFWPDRCHSFPRWGMLLLFWKSDILVNNLQLYVGKEDNIRNIQTRFSEIFPHLWISLFRHTGNNIPKQDILYSQETKITDINPSLQGGKLEIDPHMTVSTFESAFYMQFGLYAQVSRINCSRDAEKFGIERFALDEANREVRDITPLRPETILFRDVPYGC
jgi:hypothetical protein